MNHTLDASAILRYLDNEAGADEIKRLLLDAFNQKTELFMNTVNWSEVLYTFLKRSGAVAPSRIHQLNALPVTLLPIDEPLASVTATYRLNFKLHLADAFALATAVSTKSTLITGDYDFKHPGLPGQIYFLPKK
jgi:uncharacterized protein